MEMTIQQKLKEILEARRVYVDKKTHRIVAIVPELTMTEAEDLTKLVEMIPDAIWVVSPYNKRFIKVEIGIW